MTHPVIILVHGAMHSPEYYNQVIAILQPLGYKCVTVDLPSAGRLPPVTSLSEDIATIRKTVEIELDAGNDVIVSTHSYGGIPTSCALDGLSQKERQVEGKHGVVKLAFVTSLVLPEGTCLQDSIGGTTPDFWIIDEVGQCTFPDPASLFYHDLDPTDAKYWVSKLRPQSVATFRAKVTSPAWLMIPAAYLVCEDDRMVPAAFQDAMIAGVKDAGGMIEVERVSGSHSPHLTKPNKVADFLRRAAGETI